MRTKTETPKWRKHVKYGYLSTSYIGKQRPRKVNRTTKVTSRDKKCTQS